MIKKNLLIKNTIQKEFLNKNLENKLSKDFKKITEEINNNIENVKNIYNILSNNFIFNFKIKDLKNFKKFNNIAIFGMGGSILGSEAIYEFLGKKIKKKVHFFNDMNEDKITNFKKKKSNR